MKRSFTIGLVVFIFITTLATFIYILDNLFLILEKASVMTLKPIKTGVPKELILRQVPYAEKEYHKLDIYTIPADSRPRPVLIFIPGGLWSGSNKKNYAHIGGMGQRNGFVSVILQLPGYYGFLSRQILDEEKLEERRFLAQKRSLEKAIFWIHRQITHYRGDPNNILIIAYGSGAHLIALSMMQKEALTRTIKKSIRKMIFLSPFLDILNTSNDFEERYLRPIFGKEFHQKNSPLQLETPLNMPVLILSPETDFSFMKKQTLNFAQKHKNIQYKVIPNSTRKSLVFKLGRRYDQTTKEIKSFWKI